MYIIRYNYIILTERERERERERKRERLRHTKDILETYQRNIKKRILI